MIHRLVALLRDRPRLTLGVYWTLAFVVTHIPPLFPRGDEQPEFPIGPDKVVHFGGFLTLAFLLSNVLARGLGPAASTSVVLVICGLYGIFDEISQPPFGRTADPWDWVADLLGAGAGVLLYRLARRRGL